MIGAIVVIILGTVFFITLIYCISATRKNSQNGEAIMTQNEKINRGALEYLKKNGFTLSHICYLSDYASARTPDKNKKQMLCFDAEKKKIAIIDYVNGRVAISGFADIINYEVYENGKTDTSGGVIYGMVLTNSQEKCQELKLILRLKSYTKPQAEYFLISNTLFNGGVDKSKSDYKQIRDDLQKAVSYLEMILHENKNG